MSCSVAAGEFYWFCLEKVTCSAGVSGRLRWEEVGISTDFYSFFGAVPEVRLILGQESGLVDHGKGNK